MLKTSENERLYYLYIITNKINNKIYIGQTVNTSKRWSWHKTSSKDEIPELAIGRAIKKYGINNTIK